MNSKLLHEGVIFISAYLVFRGILSDLHRAHLSSSGLVSHLIFITCLFFNDLPFSFFVFVCVLCVET